MSSKSKNPTQNCIGFFDLFGKNQQLLANYRNIAATKLAFSLKFYHAVS